MNLAIMIAFQNLEMTKKAVKSVLDQDVEGGIELWFVNNGSTDGTDEWAREMVESHSGFRYVDRRHKENDSPVEISNRLLMQVFNAGYGHVLGVPNDVVLPPYLYREFLLWRRGIVTGSMTTEPLDPAGCKPSQAHSENTPMAVMLVRDWVYRAVTHSFGRFFDEDYFHYCSDCQLALDLAACGIRGVQTDVPYWHFGSASWKTADSETRNRIFTQAEEDRATFLRKNGFSERSEEYVKAALDLNRAKINSKEQGNG